MMEEVILDIVKDFQIAKLRAENALLRETLKEIDTLIDGIKGDSVAITLTAISYRIDQALMQSPDVQGGKDETR